MSIPLFFRNVTLCWSVYISDSGQYDCPCGLSNDGKDKQLLMVTAKHVNLGLKKLTPRLSAFRTAKYVGNSISKKDARLLERMITRPVHFVDNPAFHSRRPANELRASFEQGENNFSGAWPRLMPFDMFEKVDKARSPFKPLTREQEIRLFLKLNYARYMIYAILLRHADRPVTVDLARNLLQWKHRELKVRAQIMEANVPLIVAVASRVGAANVEMSDLISEAGMALLRSIDAFDCSREIKFSTYAYQAIRNGILRLRMRASNYRRRFPVQFDPDFEQAGPPEIKRKDIKADLVDRIRHMLDSDLGNLSALERTIVQRRFAIYTEGTETSPMTLREVGQTVGLTKERIRQIQNTALMKLRTAMEDGVLSH